ncbi:hypothetical protein RBU61_02930 [Tissierella sp. MB52-C2]|uniref:hypothetical protein n=1 Tax=Tissierella sp. MB52-C2 TaxID=3070999 RepID=UPI00280BA206|nr:hypothetical protein [Tissierella sp. MB52-C2]WMM25638.1 hypothetical protein RBU61_02930 [Tissierella sp. MB52-C2]
MSEQVIKKKRSKLALISWVLTLMYLIYLIGHFGGGIGSTTGAEQAGAAIATALVFPHMLCVGIGLIFNILGYFLNKRGFILTGAILYSVSILLFMLYFMFIIVQMILSYIAFAKMKKE